MILTTGESVFDKRQYRVINSLCLLFFFARPRKCLNEFHFTGFFQVSFIFSLCEEHRARFSFSWLLFLLPMPFTAFEHLVFATQKPGRGRYAGSWPLLRFVSYLNFVYASIAAQEGEGERHVERERALSAFVGWKSELMPKEATKKSKGKSLWFPTLMRLIYILAPNYNK